jgi:hypothetical protein
MGWARNMRNTKKVYVTDSERKRLLRRPKRKWEDNIKTDLTEIVFGGVDWINLAHDRDDCRALVNTVINLQIP